MDRKKDNGAEIHNSACGRSGIMMRIRILKSAKNQEEQKCYRDNLPIGTKLLKELIMPLANMYRIIPVNSYFESVPVA